MNNEQRVSSDPFDVLSADSVLDSTIRPVRDQLCAGAGTAQEPTVLLTGASGFVGAHVLDTLLTRGVRVVCLVRAASDLEAARRVQSTLSCYRLEQRAVAFQACAADLSLPRFGLSHARFMELASQITHVAHSAASVHAGHSYEQLRGANVHGTAELLRFCVSGRPKRLCHLSSLSVFHGSALAVEDAAPPYSPGSRQGYFATKWVSEQLVWQAIGRGIDAFVVRLGWIAGSSQSGIQGRADAMSMVIRASIRLGVSPRLAGAALPLTPADIAARAVVLAMFEQPAGTRAANLRASHVISEDALWSSLARADTPVRIVAPEIWRRELATRFPMMLAAAPTRHAFFEEDEPRPEELLPVIEDHCAHELLARSTPRLPSSQQLLAAYRGVWS